MVNRDSFLHWVEKHFDPIEVKGDEIKINSPFTQEPDYGHHCWCNPEKNAYHCFKSEAHGSLTNLVMITEKCDFDEAIEILGGDHDLRLLEMKLAKFFAEKRKKEKKPNKVSLPPQTYLIATMNQDSRFRRLAENYLASRHLPINNLQVCVDGRYRDRIIIPYYGPEGELIYFNSRDITNRSRARYLGPDQKESNVGKGDVLWFNKWPKEGEKIYLTEGEFDAMSLCVAGFSGVACGGKNISPKQTELMRPYDVCLSFDGDKYGREALNRIGEHLLRSGIRKVSFIRPAEGCKDWNDMLIKYGPEMIVLYISKNERPFSAAEVVLLKQDYSYKVGHYEEPHI